MRGPFQEPDPRNPFRTPVRIVQIGAGAAAAGAGYIANSVHKALLTRNLFRRRTTNEEIQKVISAPSPFRKRKAFAFHKARSSRRNFNFQSKARRGRILQRRDYASRRRYRTRRYRSYPVVRSYARHRGFSVRRNRYLSKRNFYKRPALQRQRYFFKRFR